MRTASITTEADTLQPIPNRYPLSRIPVGYLLISFYCCSVLMVLSLVASHETRHWFVIPVLACGTLVGVDVVRILRGELSVFDPVGLFSVVGFHFFFVAPLLHVVLSHWMAFVVPPDDWRPWLGKMALLNFLGLAALFGARGLVLSLREHRRYSAHWVLNQERFGILVGFLLVVTGLLQLLVYQRFGGIAGYINSFEEGAENFDNMGLMFLFSESFPLLAMMAFVVWASGDVRRQSWGILATVLVIYFVLTLLFGGLRGSRGHTLWAIYWAVGLIHFWVREVPRKVLLIGAVGAVLFMYGYGFYKSLGTDAMDVLASQRSLSALEEQSNRSLEGLLLSDLGRSDVQAFLLYRLTPRPAGGDYELAWGRTYLGSASLLIPRWIWSERPPTKRVFATEVQYGADVSLSTGLSTRVYGLAGEGMLNFGPLFVPIGYAILGCIIGVAQRWRNALPVRDSRLLIAPFMAILAFYFLVWDSDNLLVLFFKRGALPIGVVLLCSIKVKSLRRT